MTLVALHVNKHMKPGIQRLRLKPMDSEEPWHLELPWCAARCGVLVASAAALRKGTAWVSGLALGALFLWSSWELRSARGRLRDRL